MLGSDLWTIPKSFGTYTPEEELEAWRGAVRVLEGFCQVADGLSSEPLILVLVDAKVRAEEEHERAYDRANRPEGAEASLGPREEKRLKHLLRRSDALSNAYAVVHDHAHGDPARDEMLEHLAQLGSEAGEAFMRYRQEIGLPWPGKSREADEYPTVTNRAGASLQRPRPKGGE